MAFYSAFWGQAYWNQGYQVARNGEAPPVESLNPNGGRPREYQPTYHELREQREIERKFEEAELNLKATQIKVEELEFKRLSDLADRAMQMELLQLLAQRHELEQLLYGVQQQKLRALNEDDELMLLIAYLN